MKKTLILAIVIGSILSLQAFSSKSDHNYEGLSDSVSSANSNFDFGQYDNNYPSGGMLQTSASKAISIIDQLKEVLKQIESNAKKDKDYMPHITAKLQSVINQLEAAHSMSLTVHHGIKHANSQLS